MKKVLVGIVLLLSATIASAHITNYIHCHGSYYMAFDQYGNAYHQHVGWWHYI